MVVLRILCARHGTRYFGPPTTLRDTERELILRTWKRRLGDRRRERCSRQLA